MQTMITYKGTKDGVKGLWCGFLPEDVIVEEEITVYKADKGKVFIKDGEEYDCVVLQDGETIEDYTEVEKQEDDRADT